MQEEILPRGLPVNGGAILYDAAQGGKVHEHVFSLGYWRVRDALGEPLGGRGAAWRIQAGGIDWVLRQYRRGGLPGKLILDSYLYLGLGRTRPWREWHLLAWMHELGLPVPRPVAARVLQFGLSYRGAIITETVPGRSLAARLRDHELADDHWRAVGACIRRFHAAGVWHADLNAHNILVADDGRVHLIDFDRGRRRTPRPSWQAANLARLRRSLDKLAPAGATARVEAGWRELHSAYQTQ